VRRLRGIDGDVMPPTGKLAEENIALIETWIAEGAKYDGGDSRLPLAEVAAVARANSVSHEELALERDQLALKNWKLITGDDDPEVISSGQFRVVGTARGIHGEDVSALAESLSKKITRALKSDTSRPMVKGKTTIYVFERRYDLNELGTMLAGRELPKELSGYWDYTTVDGYASVLLQPDQSVEDIEATLAQQLAALHVSTLRANVPRWFADGMGYWAAARALPKNEDLKSIDQRSREVVRSMQRPDDFAQGRMPEHLAALAAYAYIKSRVKGSGLVDGWIDVLPVGLQER
jgi:hypothetical protein